MRWIVISLVLLNIGVLVYFQLFAKEEVVVVSEEPTRPQSGVQTLTLLSEQEASEPIDDVKLKQPDGAATKSVRPAAQPDLLANARPPEPPVLPKPLEQPLCTLVGSFERLLKAEYFVERLQSLGLSATVKNVVVDSDPGYWLHLPPEKSRKEALRRLSELQGRGIDSYVIPSGNLANGISLGMFTAKSGASTMQKRIRNQGYQPQIVEVPREQKEIWAFLPEGEAAKLSDERWAELLSSEEYLQKRQNVCSDVASY